MGYEINYILKCDLDAEFNSSTSCRNLPVSFNKKDAPAPSLGLRPPHCIPFPITKLKHIRG